MQIHNLAAGSYAQTAENTLGVVSLDKRVGVAVVFLGHFALEALGVDVVELSDGQELTLVILAAAALKTSLSLSLSLFLGKAERYLVKVFISNVRRQNLGSNSALLLSVGLVDCAFVAFADVGHSGVERHTVKISVNSLCAAVSLTDSLNRD